jgi:O-antigen/teichoic acid export membrane protein
MRFTKHKAIIISAGYSLLFKVGVTVLGLLSTILLARFLGPSDLGTYTLILTLVMFISLPIKAGLPQLMVREISKYISIKQYEKIKGILIFSNSFVIIFSLISIFILSLVNLYFEYFEYVYLILIGLIIVILSLNEIRGAVLRAFGRYNLGQLPDNIFRPFVFLLSLVVVYLINFEINVITVLVCYLFSIISSFFMGAIFLLKNENFKEIKEVRSEYNIKLWILASFPMALTNIFYLSNTQIDILLLGYYFSASEVGLYKISIQMSLLIAFSLQASKMISEPIFAKMYNNKLELQKTITIISRINFIFALIVFLFILLFGEMLISFMFGEDYISAYIAFIILAIGRLMSALFGAGGYLLNMGGFEKQYANIWLLTALLNIVLNFIIIPIGGINGAALSTSLSLIFANLLTYFKAKKLTNLKCSPF